MTQEEANTHLREALIAHAEAHGIAEPGVLLSDFVVVAAWVPTDEGPSRTYYTTQFPSHYMPTHTMVGLLEVGLERAYVDLTEGDED